MHRNCLQLVLSADGYRYFDDIYLFMVPAGNIECTINGMPVYFGTNVRRVRIRLYRLNKNFDTMKADTQLRQIILDSDTRRNRNMISSWLYGSFDAFELVRWKIHR